MGDILKMRESDRQPGDGPSRRGFRTVSGIVGFPSNQAQLRPSPPTEEEREAERRAQEAERRAGEKAEELHKKAIAKAQKTAETKARKAEAAAAAKDAELAELRDMVKTLASTVKDLKKALDAKSASK